jgi:hypothetical protein
VSTLKRKIRESCLFQMLAKSCKVLWIVKVDQRSIEAFTRSSDKTRNECHVNMVEYSSESLDDEETDMCMTEWNWASKCKPFVRSSLKPTSKSWPDEMRYTFYITKCDRIFDYLLQKKIK